MGFGEGLKELASRLTGKTSGKSAKPSPDLSRLDESTSYISSRPLGTKERSCEKGDREHRKIVGEEINQGN